MDTQKCIKCKGGKIVARDLCNACYQRMKAKGSLNEFPRHNGVFDSIKSVLAHVDIDEKTGCWIWRGAKTMGGYGYLRWEGRIVRVSRFFLYAYKGFDLDSPFNACHSCDNPPCVNPDHLFVGTQKDNMSDCRKKGRMIFPDTRGIKNSSAKLSEKQVQEIRKLLADGQSTRCLAKKYSVSQTSIARIQTGRNWAHLLMELH